MEVFLILNFYFFLNLIFCEICKKKYVFLKIFSILDLYLYLILYSTVLIICFSVIGFLEKFHIFLVSAILIFLILNFKKIFKINISNFLKILLILNLYSVLCIDKEFIWWDEFSSWGLRTKKF